MPVSHHANTHACFLHLLRPHFLALALGALCQGAALAAEDALETAHTLDTVVVTATGTQQWLKDAPASISVITREEIELKPVTSIAELLRTQPGVTGGYAVSGAQSKISLRGLPYQYTLILIDGRRQGNSLGTNYRDDLGRQDLDWISPDMIERIEVVRGPMSSLYGSDAMGGVINIITRKITNEWKGTASSNYTRPSSAERGETRQLGANFSGPLTDSLGLRIGLNQTNRSADRPARSNTGQSPGFRNDTGDMRLFWNINDQHTLEAQGTRGVQKAIASEQLVLNPRCATPTPDNNYCLVPSVGAWGPSRLVHTGYGLHHDGRYGEVSGSKTSLNYNQYVSKGDPTDSEAKELVFESTFNTEVSWGIAQALTTGVQWKREELYNARTIGTVPIDWSGGAQISPRNEADSWSIFAEDHLSLGNNLTLTLGLRLDNTDNYDNNLSPRSYLVWHPAESWTVRGGVSQGYKAPNLKQGTAGAATRSGGGGCGSISGSEPGYAGGCYMAGNPNLEPETSTSYELGAGFDRDGWQISATYFVTDFDDKIEQVPLRDIPGFDSSFINGFWWTVAQNIDKARTRGAEASVRIPLHARLDWTTNMTRMLESKNRTTGADLLVTPKITAHSNFNWRPVDALLINLSAQHVGRQNTSSTRPTFAKAYTMYDLAVNWNANRTLTFRAGVRNFTNVSTLEDGSGYDGGSRVYFVGFTGRF